MSPAYILLPPAPCYAVSHDSKHAGSSYGGRVLRLRQGVLIRQTEAKMLDHELLREIGILILHPLSPLQADDFESLAKVVDPYIEQTGSLRGIMIEAPSFPGWDSFAALISHLKFIRDHHRLVAKIAAVSDSAFLSIAPQIAKHFVNAKVRHFPANERETALAWLCES